METSCFLLWDRDISQDALTVRAELVPVCQWKLLPVLPFILALIVPADGLGLSGEHFIVPNKAHCPSSHRAPGSALDWFLLPFYCPAGGARERSLCDFRGRQNALIVLALPLRNPGDSAAAHNHHRK